MGGLFFYLQNWVLPMVVVVLIYLIFLVPIYLWAKKKKIGYWPVIWLSVLVVYLVDGGLFWLENFYNENRYLAYLFFSSWIANFLFFIFIPFFVKKVIKNKLSKLRLFVSYFLLFFIQIVYVLTFFIWMAIELSRFF